MRRPLHVRAAVGAAVAAAAFALYYKTLLPGLDFGDTASFQVMAGSPVITPRDAYPLYFAIARVFAVIVPGDPAYVLNFASAVEAAAGCGLLVLVAFELSGSLLASVAAAAAFAGSYTFWSQSIIAEVYALHTCLVLGTLLLLLRWGDRQTLSRLAMFFAVYAFGFGNHLSMVLLLPAYALFLLVMANGGWRTMVAPRIVLLAISLASLGALQYAWNLHTLWRIALPPASFMDALKTFWFDVTKSDWRDTMILQVPADMTAERLRMYAFEVAQQFGWVLPIVAIAGVWELARCSPARAALILGAYVANVLFAFGYNVGDSHVFFLPSHLMIALLIAPGLVRLDRLAMTRGAVTVLAIVLATARGYDNYPALDRHEDMRPQQVLDALTAQIDDQHAILLTDLNWQVQNGLNYYAKYSRPELAFARMPDVLLYAPALVRDNAVIGRRVVLSDRARIELDESYGPYFSVQQDSGVHVPTLTEIVGDLAPGTRYALSVLQPGREFTIDQTDLARSLDVLTGGAIHSLPQNDYIAVAGIASERPDAITAGNRPFRTTLSIGNVPVQIRMESWLEFDTIRRMGFGQIVAARRHTLILDRGISFVAFDDQGRPLRSAYLANIFAAQPRYVIMNVGSGFSRIR